jgi:hypothetical protein
VKVTASPDPEGFCEEVTWVVVAAAAAVTEKVLEARWAPLAQFPVGLHTRTVHVPVAVGVN